MYSADRQWLSQNCLKLNDGQTELMVISQPNTTQDGKTI